MNDVKLFAIEHGALRELEAQAPQIEKALQTLLEENLEALLGVRFLASEFSTGPVHGGRIDTLGLDEDGTPVIIEYKRTISENVINQGLFYLDWLLDHRKDFQWLVMDKLGQGVANSVDWSQPRLLCIAADFTKYDSYAVNQIPRAIELIRYKRFDSRHLMIELVHTPKAISRTNQTSINTEPSPGTGIPTYAKQDKYQSARIAYRLANAPKQLKQLWDQVTEHLSSLGDDVQQKELSLYVAFKRIKNFACLELYPQGGQCASFRKIEPG